MDLHFNSRAAFTRWIVQSGALREPFVVVDVGVQGGENIRWHLLADHLVVYGLDPIEEVIEDLRRGNSSFPNRHYLAVAAGSADEERTFYFNAANPCSSSLYQQGDDRFGMTRQREDHVRRVPVKRLDTLLAEGAIARPDFLKIDVEGFEKDVLLGGPALLDSGVLGIETEASFNVSPVYPQTHFGTLQDILRKNHFLVFDIGFNRIPRATFQEALARKGLSPITDHQSVGRPTTVNVLFSRDLIAETDTPGAYPFPPQPTTDDQAIIKAMLIYELHGLNDIAIDTAVRFRGELGRSLDVDKAIDLLADPHCLVWKPDDSRPGAEPSRTRVEDDEPVDAAYRREIERLRRQLDAIEHSTSWRITAPLRALKGAVSRR
jgi:FkbM family methyltransferase